MENTVSYYGSLDEKVKPNKPVGYMLLDSKFKDIIAKNEKELKKRQDKMILDLRKQIDSASKFQKKLLSQIEKRIKKIDEQLPKDKKDKINGNAGKESKKRKKVKTSETIMGL